MHSEKMSRGKMKDACFIVVCLGKKEEREKKNAHRLCAYPDAEK